MYDSRPLHNSTWKRNLTYWRSPRLWYAPYYFPPKFSLIRYILRKIFFLIKWLCFPLLSCPLCIVRKSFRDVRHSRLCCKQSRNLVTLFEMCSEIYVSLELYISLEIYISFEIYISLERFRLDRLPCVRRHVCTTSRFPFPCISFISLLSID